MAQSRFLGVLLSLCACGQSQKSQPFSAENQTFLDDVELALTTPVSEQRIAEFRRVSILQFYDLLLSRTSDDPFIVNGQVVRDVRSQLSAAQPYFKKLHEIYSSWADFAAKRFNLSVAPGRHITRNVYSSMTKNFATRSGVFTKLQSTANVTTSSKKPQANQALDLLEGQQNINNLAAIAAISLVIQHTKGSGLGLAEPEITNGLSGAACTDMTDLSAVNKLEYEINGRLDSVCTGTFFKGDKAFDYMITAAHCTPPGRGDWTTKTPNGAKSRGIVVRNAPGNPPAPQQVALPANQSNDLSIIAFPAGTAKGYMGLSNASPKSGASVVLAGYGKTTQNDNIRSPVGDFHCGSNAIAQSVEQQGILKLVGIPSTTSPSAPLGSKSLIGGGDSGGPLIRIGDDGKPELVGVASSSTGYVGTLAPSPGRATYVDVNSVWSKTFINQRSKLQPADLPTCTNGSNNGDGTGTQSGIGGPDGKTCRVPAPQPDTSNSQAQGQPTGRQGSEG